MKTQTKEEEEVKYSVAYAPMIVCHWRRKEGDLTKICLT